MSFPTFDLSAALVKTRQATDQLSDIELSSQALRAMGDAITQRRDDILEANTLDLETSRDMALPDLVVDWLKLTPERVQAAASVLKRLATLGAPQPNPAFLYGAQLIQSRPVGVVGFVYEAFPDLSAIAAALCIRSGNGLVLRGGDEASQTNQVLAEILQTAIGDVGLPSELILATQPADVSRQEIAQCTDIDLVIPHGRPRLVEQVVQAATVPVLPSRMGNCYLYWAPDGSLDNVHKMIVESHAGSPDAINRIEKVLVHQSHSDNTLRRLWTRLQEDGFQLRVDAELMINEELIQAEPLDWGSAYLKRTVAFRAVQNTAEAIAWVNTHSSGHADSLATSDYTVSRQFTRQCQSAMLYINQSPQFLRNPKQVDEIALGISNRKGDTGGLIGLSKLRTHQRIIHAL